MNWFTAATTGFGLGVVVFGALWFMARDLVRRPQRRILRAASGPARYSLAAVVFYGLSRAGLDAMLAGLIGLFLARTCLVAHLGNIRYGR